MVRTKRMELHSPLVLSIMLDVLAKEIKEKKERKKERTSSCKRRSKTILMYRQCDIAYRKP